MCMRFKQVTYKNPKLQEREEEKENPMCGVPPMCQKLCRELSVTLTP